MNDSVMKIGFAMIVIGLLMGFILNMISAEKIDFLEKKVKQQEFLISSAEAKSHLEGFMDGMFWASASPFPTNDNGKLVVDISIVLDAERNAMSKRQK